MADYITYKQADSRWGGKNYNGSSTMATAGCGPTSVAMLAHAVDGKTNPWDVAKFMKKNGYAIRNNGTAWAGIPAAMKHFGLKDVRNVASMSDVFKLLNKGYCAVFLFRAGSRGGCCWTTAGHYIAVTGYKVKNGKHYLYTRDSGGRNHTGWYCYETQMKGLIPQVWCGYVPGKVKTDKPASSQSSVTVNLPAKVTSTAKKTKAQKMNERAIKDAWPKGTPKSKYRYPDGRGRKQYKEDLNKAYPNRKNWWKQTASGAACDVFVPVLIRVTDVDKKMPHGLEYIFPYLKKCKTLKVVHSKKTKRGRYYTPSIVQGGDIVVLQYKKSGAHMFTIVEKNGKKYIAEANYHGKMYPHIAGEFKAMKKSRYKKLLVYRAVE